MQELNKHYVMALTSANSINIGAGCICRKMVLVFKITWRALPAVAGGGRYRLNRFSVAQSGTSGNPHGRESFCQA